MSAALKPAQKLPANGVSPTVALKKNVQGDILIGLPKDFETFFFFNIYDAKVNAFRSDLKELIPLVSTSEQTEKVMSQIAAEQAAGTGKRLPLIGVNIAFSNKGLAKLGLNKPDSPQINDDAFVKGMLADAPELGERSSDYLPEFRQQQKQIDGVFLVAGSDIALVNHKMQQIKTIFGYKTGNASIDKVYSITGNTRPNDQRGHEQDGISQPGIRGVDLNPVPGQDLVNQGRFVIGREDDNDDDDKPIIRPDWAKDGSFLCVRILKQNVPEFKKFVDEERDPDLPAEWGRGQLGARLVGRWESGAPTDLTPMVDNVDLARDSQRNNDFDFNPASQDRCPFAAHIRKMYPRDDLPEEVDNVHRILRRGIAYGPELSHDEITSHTTSQERGLLFVSYQSNIDHGFAFLQKNWANNPNFPPQKPQLPGWDPLIGQNNGNQGTENQDRELTGTDPNDIPKSLTLNNKEWVIAKGGEYMFSPSIKCLTDFMVVAAS